MNRVGFITKSLTDGNAIRGVGFYAKRLLPILKAQCLKYKIEIVEISNVHELRTMNCELVHYPYFDLFRHTLPIFRSAKTVVTIHDVIPLEFPQIYKPGIRGFVNLQLQKFALSGLVLSGVEGVITDSKASAKSIHKYLNISESKIKSIYLAADPMFRPKKVTKKYNLPDKFVLYVGDVNWNKNISNLIQAAKLANLPLVMVGKQAAEIEKMDLNHPELSHLSMNHELITNYPIRLGFVPDEDLVDIYNLSGVYCQASYAEGFGLPVLEAMACGTQVAISNTHSLPEIAGSAAEYFNPNSVSDVSKALLKAIDNKFDVVTQAKKFSWEKTATQTLEVYRDILGS